MEGLKVGFRFFLFKDIPLYLTKLSDLKLAQFQFLLTKQQFSHLACLFTSYIQLHFARNLSISQLSFVFFLPLN